MPPLDHEAHGKQFWRSLAERADTPEFRRWVEREFPAYADEMLAPTPRRNFLKLMGASVALAGMTSCRWPSQEILPFTQRPEEFVPGLPQHYATALEIGGVASALLVKSYDGRPIKVEGNPLHPASRGSSDVFAQASVLELYDPARARDVVDRGQGQAVTRDWNWFEQNARPWFSALRAGAGRGLCVLSEANGSPSLADMRRRLLAAFPDARWYEYEPVSRDSEREGTRLIFGAPHRMQLSLDRAETVVVFDDDLLVGHPAAVTYARDHADGRSPERGLDNRLIVFESGVTPTGTMADVRVPLPPRQIPAAAACLAARLFLDLHVPLPFESPVLRGMLERFKSHPLYAEIDWAFAEAMAERRGHSALAAGPSQPAEVHALVQLMNVGLENVGQTVAYTADPDPERPSHAAAIRELSEAMAAGQVDTLLVLGGNPAYDAPADTEFAQRLAGVPHSIHLSLFENETSLACKVLLPRAHYLESWGDARDWRGRVSVGQPLIEPLYGGRSAAELLAWVVDEGPFDGYGIVRRTFAELNRGGDFEDRWRRSVHDGLLAGSEWPDAAPRARAEGWVQALESHLDAGEPPAGQLELVIAPSRSVYDGRFANSGWLQELPDSLTKLTWDNAALLGPSTADALGVGHGDLLRLERAGRSVELPVFVLPGQAAGSVSVALGYGRRHNGPAEHAVAIGVGADIYALRASDAMYVATVSVSKAAGSHLLATTQDHWALDRLGTAEREKRVPHIVREIELSDWRHDPHAAMGEGHGAHDVKLWESPVDYEGYRWGMAIDLNRCTGCNACVIACQAENNIPVVGKHEVSVGREMHWIRVDRYFAGDPERPDVVHQPVTCQHCENAPCEQVCPVAATMHDHEGLNVMVYNRCVGTRYCSNNCPFKVRRFNWFNNHKHETAIEAMVYNPEVTVRSRGVMEKCTFCVQRINAAKIQAKNDGRRVREGEITTACEQACPTRAIAFGDLNDPESRVGHWHHDARSYALLEEWNVKPRNRYLARVRNRGSRQASESHG